MSYCRYGLWIVCARLVAGCGTPSTSMTIDDRPLTLEGSYTKDYTTSGTLSYVREDDGERVASMLVQPQLTVWTRDEKRSYLSSSSYPGYDISPLRSVTSDCDITYDKATASLISDPLREEVLYLAIIFVDSPAHTTIVSHTARTKKIHNQRIQDIKASYGCSS